MGGGEDNAVDAAGLGGVHVGAGSAMTGGNATGVGLADGATRCMGMR